MELWELSGRVVIPWLTSIGDKMFHVHNANIQITVSLYAPLFFLRSVPSYHRIMSAHIALGV